MLLMFVVDGWPAPFVGFLRTYEHLGLLSGQVIISIRLEQRQVGFLFHARGFFSQSRTSLMAAYIWPTSRLCSAISFSLSIRRRRAEAHSGTARPIHCQR